MLTDFINWIKNSVRRSSTDTTGTSGVNVPNRRKEYTQFHTNDHIDQVGIVRKIREFFSKDYWTIAKIHSQSGVEISEGLADIKASSELVKSESTASFDKVINVFKTGHHFVTSEIDNFSITNFKKQWIVKADPDAQIKVFKKTMSECSFKKKLKESKKENLTERRASILTNWYQSMAVAIPFLARPFVFILLVFGLVGGGEGAITYPALQIITSETNGQCLIVCTILLTVSGMASHFLGRSIFLKKTWSVIILATVLFALVFCVTYIRVQGNLPHSLTIINLVIVVFLVWLSYYTTPYHELMRVEYAIAKLNDQIIKDVIEIESSERSIAGLKEKLETLAEEAADEHKADLVYEQQNLSGIVESLEGEKISVLASIDKAENKALSDYKTGYQFGEHHHRKSHSYNNGHTTSFSLVVILSGILSGCFGETAQGPPPTAILIDVTDRQTIKTSDILQLVLGSVMNSGVINNELNFVVGRISDQTLDNIEEFSLPKADQYLLRSERKRQIAFDHFITAITRHIDSLVENAGPRNNSYVGRSIQNVVHRMRRNFSNFNLVVVSDLLENTEQISVYQYQYDPEELIEVADSISRLLSMTYPLDLRGVSVTILHKPLPSLDRITDANRIVWNSYFYGGGAKDVFFRVN